MRRADEGEVGKQRETESFYTSRKRRVVRGSTLCPNGTRQSEGSKGPPFYRPVVYKYNSLIRPIIVKVAIGLLRLLRSSPSIYL